jgi:hypothetical protein
MKFTKAEQDREKYLKHLADTGKILSTKKLFKPKKVKLTKLPNDGY